MSGDGIAACQRAEEALRGSEWLRAPNQEDIATLRTLARDVVALADRVEAAEQERDKFRDEVRYYVGKRWKDKAVAAEARVTALEAALKTYAAEESCPYCGGDGDIDGEICAWCAGSGLVSAVHFDGGRAARAALSSPPPAETPPA